MDEVADTQFRITWPCFRAVVEEEEEKAEDCCDNDKSGKKGRKKKRKKKKCAPPDVCEMCRVGPEGAARGHVRRAALWCCARSCLVCCSALRVLITLVGVVGICLTAFYILSPGGTQDGGKEGARRMRASFRAFGARRARVRPQAPTTTAAPRDLSDRGDPTSELDTFRPVTTECGPDRPGGKTGFPGSMAACLGRNKDKLVSTPDIEMVPGPFEVVDSSVIKSPHDTAAPDEPGGPAESGASGTASSDDQGGPDSATSPDGDNDGNDLGGPSSPSADPEGQSGSDVPNDPED